MERKSPYDNRTIAKFHDKYEVDDETGCWNWTAGKYTRGYGALYNSEYGILYAHRYSYELHHGEIPEGAVVMHKCDNVACVNPDHLQAGTQKENIQDCIAKDRWMTKKRWDHLMNAPQNFRNGQPENKAVPYSKNPKRQKA